MWPFSAFRIWPLTRGVILSLCQPHVIFPATLSLKWGVYCAVSRLVGSIPRREEKLCAFCMLLFAVTCFAVLPGTLINLYTRELTVWIVFPTVVIRMYRLTPLVPLDSSLTAAACLSSACLRMFIRRVKSQWFGVTSY